MKLTERRAVVEKVFSRFRDRGHMQYGETVTEAQHALQCATFAEKSGEPSAVIVACLLHDYGHLCHEMGEDIADRGVDAQHEDIGAAHLARWFVDEIVEPVRLHVAAKRYLCWKEPTYLDGLSAASKKSLELQGGPMSAVEAQAFESNAHYDSAVRVRKYDDMGKVPDMATSELEAFRSMIEEFVKTDTLRECEVDLER